MGAIKVTAWLASGALAILLLTQPVSVEAQRTLSLTIIAVMTGVWWFAPNRHGRQVFLALGSFVAIRYMYWRITNTMPSWSDPVGFTLGSILLAAELYCVLILVISLVINVDPLERERLPREDDDKLPTVDVFIPSYNEDEYILAMTVAAAKNMDYPPEKLKVWLLDDGGTEQKCNDPNPEKAAAAMQRRVSLQLLCSQLGAIYHTRDRNEHAKAGNMNAALAHSTGEIVVVFDADHAPFRSFLRETVGYFARDPKLFLVQTPHVFLNPDPIERNLRTFSRMPSENEMFYSITQRGLDKWNASFFCGSAALLRRSALKTTGGFSGITITEDCETAFELHSKGWTSIFVDQPLIAGLQPETFASFVGQRSRWCQGMFQILLLKNPAFKRDVPDSVAEEPGIQARAELHSKDRLPLEHDLLVLPDSAAGVHVGAAHAHLLRRKNLHLESRRGDRLHRHLHVREHNAAELSLRQSALALGLRALRICTGPLSRQSHRFCGATSAQAHV
jgi:cellulose synthase (UDP-forming)